MDPTAPESTPEILSVLERYLQIQKEEQELKQEKAALQEKLKTHLASTGCRQWNVEAAGESLRVVGYDRPAWRVTAASRPTGLEHWVDQGAKLTSGGELALSRDVPVAGTLGGYGEWVEATGQEAPGVHR